MKVDGTECMEQKTTRPTQDQVSHYLNELRESGVTNMFGARPYVQKKFAIDQNRAGEMLSFWMENYEKGESEK